MQHQDDSFIGKQFHRLTVVCRTSRYSGKSPVWQLICECGNITFSTKSRLNSGHTKSCGCLMRDTARERASQQRKHGLSNTRTYRCWSGAKNRVTNKKDKDWYKYGGRGIYMSPSWKNDFTMFLSDMGECPPNHSLGRIDNDGPYSVDNCRWETNKQQCNNKSNNRKVLYNGVYYTFTELAEFVGLNENTLRTRVFKLKWTIYKACTTPLRGMK